MKEFSHPGQEEKTAIDINKSIERSKRFMTLFYSEIDAKNKQFCWVRAGHDPAIVYDPRSNEFDELKGRGLPLGVMADTEYSESQYHLAPGQIIVISTDGICEATLLLPAPHHGY